MSDYYLEYTRCMFVIQTLFRFNEHWYLRVATADRKQFNSESTIRKRFVGLNVIEDNVHLSRILRVQHMRHYIRVRDGAESTELKSERSRSYRKCFA